MKIVDKKYFKYILLALFIVTTFWSVWVMPKAIKRLSNVTHNYNMLDLNPTYNSHEAYANLTAAGVEGRKVLVTIYTFEDFVFPIVYGLLFFCIAAYFLRKNFPNKNYMLLLSILPLGMMVLDFFENFTIVFLIEAYPKEIPSVANRAGVFTMFKWALGISSLFIILGSVVAFLVKKYGRKKTHADQQ